ncbi:MAG TPA: hypothetical protein VFV38_20030, partial [Ktedonobacteraceae bacterium]|nr:hypothetical protein [Ktedonobacteraceae bacterium]
LYKNDPLHYERVKRLDKNLLAQVQMRYEVFFNAMHGQLDGDLSYDNADAVYLRVRGFTLRQEAPRLGRFLVADFMHYIAERRRAGGTTLFIIDEFNALRMREETSILFEQVRSFGGSLIIAAQGYAGLGPREYADRILDATNTYILHSCSDPFPVVKRAGKRFRLETSWNEQEGENVSARRQIRPRWDWKVPENAVMQQTEGQAFWINRGRAQQAQTARVPLTSQQIADAWEEIHRQEEEQRAKLEQMKRKQAGQQARAKGQRLPPDPGQPTTSPKKENKAPSALSTKTPPAQKLQKQGEAARQSPALPSSQAAPVVQSQILQDDEPDRL